MPSLTFNCAFVEFNGTLIDLMIYVYTSLFILDFDSFSPLYMYIDRRVNERYNKTLFGTNYSGVKFLIFNVLISMFQLLKYFLVRTLF